MSEPAPRLQFETTAAPEPEPRDGPVFANARDSRDRPRVDVRVVLITVAHDAPWVVVQAEDDRRWLPRGAPLPARDLDTEARRIVRTVAGLHDQYLEQLYTLSAGSLDSWTIVVSYLALILPEPGLDPAVDPRWRRVDETILTDPVDQMVLDYAMIRLRAKIGYTTIAFHLLPPAFTLTELQGAYEAILGRTLDKRNFRRRLLADDVLESTGQTRREGSHRPALLYRFRDPHDASAYLTPPWNRAGNESETT